MRSPIRLRAVQPTAPALVSGEGVPLALVQAGVGSRVVAAALDFLIQGVALLVVVLVDVAVAGGADSAAFDALVTVESVLIIAGYPIVAEWLGRGRTIGKLAFGLRVVRDDGGPIGFRQALVRGLAGFVLEKPGLLPPLSTVAGLVTMSTSTREKRLGDMLAGTVVLNERAGGDVIVALPDWVPPALQQWALSVDLHRLDDQLALQARQFVTRAYAMTPAAQLSLGDELSRRVLAVTSPPPPLGTPTPVLLMSVLAERRRRAMTGAWPTPPAAPPTGWGAPAFGSPNRQPGDPPNFAPPH